jgi:hypothetical protein
VGNVENMYNTLARKPQGRAPLGTSRHRWEFNIELVLRWKLVLRMWTDSTQVPVVGFCKHFNKLSGSIRGREFLD